MEDEEINEVFGLTVESNEAPPAAEEESCFRGSGTVGVPDEGRELYCHDGEQVTTNEPAEGAGEQKPDAEPPTGAAPVETPITGAGFESTDAALAQARVDKAYADMFAGQSNPFAGAPIRGEADYLAYQQGAHRQQAEAARVQMEQQLQEAGIAPDVLRQLVSQQVESHPAVQQAQQAAMAVAHERAMLVQREASVSIAKSLETIAADFPEVKTLEDIAKLPCAGRFQTLVNQGIALEDAFFLANRQEYTKRQRESSRQAAINASRSKEHLNAGVGVAAGAEAVDVPADAMEGYRAVMPGATDAEIRAAYGKYLRNLK